LNSKERGREMRVILKNGKDIQFTDVVNSKFHNLNAVANYIQSQIDKNKDASTYFSNLSGFNPSNYLTNPDFYLTNGGIVVDYTGSAQPPKGRLAYCFFNKNWGRAKITNDRRYLLPLLLLPL
jgi:hypothetical protein